ncbi:MAG: ComEC family competence protein [Candidatus Doudnabacteria bacterium]|nr:ComEC family competence protein [Candidatus Doudnabacteria bacterium]
MMRLINSVPSTKIGGKIPAQLTKTSAGMGKEASLVPRRGVSKSKIFLIFCLAFIVGVWLGKYASYEIMALSAMIFAMVVSLGWSSRAAKVIGFAGLILVLGMARISFSLQAEHLSGYLDQTVEVVGLIVDEPDVRSDKTYLTVGRLKVNNREIDSKLLLTTSLFPEYHYGDQIQFRKKITAPRDAEAQGEFSYKNYLSKSGIEAVVYYPDIELLASRQGNFVKASLFQFKQAFIGKISEILPEPHHSFLAGLLVGLRRGIPEQLLADFNTTGVTHIIALSGFNITIIAQAFDRLLLNWFRRRVSFILSLVAIVLFVIMTGAQASVVRAAVMGILGMLALNTGRLDNITNALVLTGAVMLAINPQILHFDIGFQLSFLALMGLVYLAPRMEPYFVWLWRYLREIVVATLSAQIFVLPVLLLNFDRLSLIAPITNVLILPLIPFAMLFGFLAGMLGLIWTGLALPLAWITWAMLEYVMQVVKLTARVPLASINFSNFGIWLLLLYYLVLIYYINKHRLAWTLKLKTLLNFS